MVRVKIIFIFLLELIAPSICQKNPLKEPAVCGGFLKLDPSIPSSSADPKSGVSLDVVNIGLYSADNILRFNAKPNAHNGYYFMPVYESGAYYIKIVSPVGWRFEPQRHILDVRSTQSCNTEFNFVLSGFSVVGSVVVKSDDSSRIPGPAGLAVKLSNAAGTQTTRTNAAGEFSFDGVKPGSYKMEIDSPDYEMLAGSQTITVTNENLNVTALGKPFVIVGFSTSGRVVSDRKTRSPMAGVDIFLCAPLNSQNSVSGSSNCKRPQNIPPQFQQQLSKDLAVVCSLKTDADGKFKLTGVPPGAFTVFPFYMSEQTVFDILPQSKAVTIVGDNVMISEEFYVTGFTVRGRLLYSAGDSSSGVANAQVKLDAGAYTATTDSAGNFAFSGLSAREYDVSVNAEAAGAQFEPVRRLVTPASSLLAPLSADRLQVCGSVTLQTRTAELLAQAGAQLRALAIAFTRRTTTTANKEQVFTVTAEASGKFCVFLPAGGEYDARVQLTNEQSLLGLHFEPPTVTIKLNKPNSNAAQFVQSVYKLTGEVQCLEECGGQQLALTASARNNDASKSPTLERVMRLLATQITLPASVRASDAKLVSAFSFELPFEARYTVTLQPSVAAWYWSASEHVLSVTHGQPLAAVSFVQLGYKVALISSHKVLARLERVQGDGAVAKVVADELQLAVGANSVMVHEPGRYRVVPRSECVRFEQAAFEFSTDALRLVQLRAAELLFGASVEHESAAGQEFVLNCRLRLTRLVPGTSEKHVEMLEARLDSTKAAATNQTAKAPQTSKRVFNFDFWVPHDIDQFDLAPSSEAVLFEPETLTVRMSELQLEESCPFVKPGTIRFRTVPALIITGAVRPAVADVGVKVTLRQPESKSDSRRVLETTTDAQGQYRFPPVPKSLAFELEMSRAGYVFTHPSPTATDFVAVKLAEIALVIQTEKLTPIKGALVSLTSQTDGSVRAHKFSGADGRVAFADLRPDSTYYVSAVLKEYEFEPSTLVVRLEPDAGYAPPSERTLLARRVAYSLYGAVHAAYGGAPEPGVLVVATPTPQSRQSAETGVSEDSGNFRVSGLKANTTYTISTKPSAHHPTASLINHFVPNTQTIAVGETDVEGLVILSVRRPTFVDLSIEVQLELEPSEARARGFRVPQDASGPLTFAYPDLLEAEKVNELFAHAYIYVLRDSTHEVLVRQSLRNLRFYSTEDTVPIDNLNYIAHVEQNIPSGSFGSVGGVGVGGTLATYFSDEADVLFRANTSQIHLVLKYHPKSGRGLFGGGGAKGFSIASYTQLEAREGRFSWVRWIISVIIIGLISYVLYLALVHKPTAGGVESNRGQEGALGRVLSLISAAFSSFGALKSRVEAFVRQSSGGGGASRSSHRAAYGAFLAARSRAQRTQQPRPAARPEREGSPTDEAAKGALKKPKKV